VRGMRSSNKGLVPREMHSFLRSWKLIRRSRLLTAVRPRFSPSSTVLPVSVMALSEPDPGGWCLCRAPPYLLLSPPLTLPPPMLSPWPLL